MKTGCSGATGQERADARLHGPVSPLVEVSTLRRPRDLVSEDAILAAEEIARVARRHRENDIAPVLQPLRVVGGDPHGRSRLADEQDGEGRRDRDALHDSLHWTRPSTQRQATTAIPITAADTSR